MVDARGGCVFQQQQQGTENDQRGQQGTNPVCCVQVSVEKFEAQKLTTSQLALVELLEGIVNNKDMAEKEKKRRLKQVNTAVK